MQNKIQVTPNGIKKYLKRYKVAESIAEYVWNGFDARATKVEINFETHELGGVVSLEIKDNGWGINNKKLAKKFKPFLESEKELDPNAPRLTSDIHGKNGVGRLTFFNFAEESTWKTTYKEGNKKWFYEITVHSKELHSYSSTQPIEANFETGTVVSFDKIFGLTAYAFESEIQDYLSREFGWYLELFSTKKSLTINGKSFDYSNLVSERESKKIKLNGSEFDVRYIRWSKRLNDEYSRYYFIDSKDKENHTETTTLNNKGDHFFHSLFVESVFFDNFNLQINLSPMYKDLPQGKTYRALQTQIEDYLREKRKPFLKAGAEKLIIDLESNNALPNFGTNEWDKLRKENYEEFIKELYQVEPKIFTGLNIQQQKTFSNLLFLVMDSGERDELLEIISQIVQLTTEERNHLANTLKITTLSSIIKTIKLIEDRIKVVNDLKELVFNTDLQAKEVPHLQNAIEKHYWIFGEQYHLVTAAEPKFEEALRRFVYKIREDKVDGKIEHEDKLAEMDIFMVRQQMIDREKLINSVCVELKYPKINLGKKQVLRLQDYRDVILNADEFKGKNIFWEFYLIGNGFDNSGYIEREIESAKGHGEKSLIYSIGNCKMYVKTWSEVFAEFELRHDFLLDKLKLEREKLSSESNNADEIVKNLATNSAVSLAEMTMPA
jgi:Histidine kinase-, DNA gyrase B-, and HSP90-like ATPase